MADFTQWQNHLWLRRHKFSVLFSKWLNVLPANMLHSLMPTLLFLQQRQQQLLLQVTMMMKLLLVLTIHSLLYLS